MRSVTIPAINLPARDTKGDYWEEKNYGKFCRLIDEIKEAGFNKQTFKYKAPPEVDPTAYKSIHSSEVKDLEYSITIFNRIKTKGRSVEFIKEEGASYLDHAAHINKFFTEYAQIIWEYLERFDPELEEKIIKDFIDESISRTMAGIKKPVLYTHSLKGKEGFFSDKALENVKNILIKDLTQRVKKAKSIQNEIDFWRFPEKSPESRGWIAKENDMIDNIYGLYQKYTPLSKNKTAYSMALVFLKLNLLPTSRKTKEPKGTKIAQYEQKIKMRLPKDREKMSTAAIKSA